jgi:hypothetical protein
VAERVLDRPFFDVLADDRQLSQTFNEGMTGMSCAVGEAILSTGSFPDTGLVVDVGGGEGALLASILRGRPHVRGIVLDTESAVAGARELLALAGLSDRCQCVGGDFMDRIPSGGDVYVLKHVLHDWPDERATAILRNVRAAIGANPDARLLVIEVVLADAAGGSEFGRFSDLAMLALVGGRERTAAQFSALMERSGFEFVRLTATRSMVSVIEARPRD